MKFRILLIALLLLTFAAPTLAQEATDEPTPVVTETPAPPVVNIPNADTYIGISTLVFGIVVAVLGGGTVGVILLRFGQNKAALDAGEKLYEGLSPDAQKNFREMFEQVREIAIRALDIVDKLTDGKENVTDATAFKRPPL